MPQKTITEQQICAEASLAIMQRAINDWPVIYDNLKQTFKDKFIIQNENWAKYDLGLAAITLTLQQIRNIFTKDQAERMEKWIRKCVDNKDTGEYAQAEIEKYDHIFNKAIHDSTHGGSFKGMNPISVVSTALLQKWLGDEKFRQFEVVMNGKKTGVIDPILIGCMDSILVAFAIPWRKFKNDADIIQGDLPFDFDTNLEGLKDYDPETKNKPIFIDGKQYYRTLVKGIWEGIKETTIELTEDQIKKFVDEDGLAYATAIYRKGKLEFFLTAKRLWTNSDKVEQIIQHPDLTEAMKISTIKKVGEAKVIN